MKKITILISAFVGINFCIAQNHFLYGTCYSAGTLYGTIFRANLDGSNLHSVYLFQNTEGAMPWGKIAQAPNGKIYGVTELGGCSDSCTLYEYDPVAGICTDVYDFYCNPPYSGEPSQNGLIILPDGYLYGLQQNGIIYKFNPITHVYALLNQILGGDYRGGLMQASDGALYGTAFEAPSNIQGTIFRYILSSNTYSVIYNFDGTHGASPYYMSLIQAADGKLYGTAAGGGAYGGGVIFSYDLSSNIYTDLHDLDSTGVLPMGGLIQATNGNLYGMTYQGGTNNLGVIFSYDISTSQYSVLYNFDGTNGANPERGLTQASNGKLFGTTYNGGTTTNGVAFSYDIATNTYTKLIDFANATGTHPRSDIQEMVLPIETGIATANATSPLIYVDASNQLIVRGSALGDRGMLEVYDAQGRNVFQSEVKNQKSEFDLSSYTNGIYFVQLKTNAKLITQKIVLSK